ncbi:leucine-rich repeat domain-containing protein [Levilactobacillus senmaizukei]|nr:leucine-rich repeat domain-containing protein [Levilactobacillus senmaizukei]
MGWHDMHEEKLTAKHKFCRSSCKWLYASATMVGLSAGVLADGHVAHADTDTGDAVATSSLVVNSQSGTGSKSSSSSSDNIPGAGSTANPDVWRRGTSLKQDESQSGAKKEIATAAKVGSQRNVKPVQDDETKENRHAGTGLSEDPVGQEDPQSSADNPVTKTISNENVQTELTYALNDQGTAYTVTGFASGHSGDHATSLVIPDDFLGKPIVAVGAGAFKGAGLTSVTLGQKIQWIEPHAFEDNVLKSIVLPDGLWSVGTEAFANNQLTSLDLNRVVAINSGAFEHNAITSLVVPNTVTGIGEQAFMANAITTLELGDQVTTIGTSAFENNVIGGTLVLPDTLTGLGVRAFANNQLIGVTLDSGLSVINTGVFSHNLLRGTLTLPITITSVGDEAFSHNRLTGLTLNDTLTSIGTAAFAHNLIESSLTLPESLKELGDRAFYDNRLTALTLNHQITGIGTRTFADNPLAGVLDIPDNITHIGEEAFDGDALTGLTGGTKLETIEQSAFLGNHLAGVLNLADTLTVIGHDAFAGNDLSGLIGGANLATINDRAFDDNRLAGILKLSDTVHDIGQYAFAHNDLAGLQLGDVVNSLANYSFAYNDLKNINATGKIGTIGDFAFAGQRNLDHVETDALVVNQNGTVTTTVFHVRTAIMKRLGLSNLNIAGLSFIDTDTQEVLTYDSVNDTLTLPLNFEGATIIVSLNTDSTDTGRYGVTNLTLDMTRRVVADVAIPSNLVDEGMSDYLAIFGADKVGNMKGLVGDTILVDVPNVPGWVADKATIQATVNADGTITAIEAVIYSPDTNPDTGHDQPTTPTDPSDPTDPHEPTTPVNPSTPTAGGNVTTPTAGGTVAPVVDDHKAAFIAPVVQTTVKPHWTYRDSLDKSSKAGLPHSGTPGMVNGRFKQTGQADLVASTNGQVLVKERQEAVPVKTSAAKQTLPQTNDHQTGWQWLGWALLTILGWLGLAQKKRRQ